MKFADLHLDEGPVFNMMDRFMTKLHGDRPSTTTAEYEAKKKEFSELYGQARRARDERERRERVGARNRELHKIALGGKAGGPNRDTTQGYQLSPSDHQIIDDVAVGIMHSLGSRRQVSLDDVRKVLVSIFKPGMGEGELLKAGLPHFAPR